MKWELRVNAAELHVQCIGQCAALTAQPLQEFDRIDEVGVALYCGASVKLSCPDSGPDAVRRAREERRTGRSVLKYFL